MASTKKSMLLTAASAIILMAYLVMPGTCPAQSDEWVWRGGSNGINTAGDYGTQGVASSDNMPGARYGSIAWIDDSGNMWLFGGIGYDGTGSAGFLNDLWSYDPDPVTPTWTWVSGSNTTDQAGIYNILGIADPANVPGARNDSVSWLDRSGNLWLFGGDGFDNSTSACGGIPNYTGCLLNDLWRYDGSEWAWMSGSNIQGQAGFYVDKGFPNGANVPGARKGAVSWMGADGYIWLFGGYGVDSSGSEGLLNDLWSFDNDTLEWTWVSGSDTADQTGSYGTLGTPDAANVPGARRGAVSWIDAGGNLLLFGGYGKDGTGSEGRLNDLWRYDPVAKMWTWVSGTSLHSQIGIYGDGGYPGCREEAVSWTDATGSLWLLGGFGLASTYSPFGGRLNDLWNYDNATQAWTWVSGSSLMDQAGVYGTLGEPDAANVPGARRGAVSWADEDDNLWLFGGFGFDGDGSYGYLNDLWSFGTIPCVADEDCDDGLFCTGNETCTGGVCGAGTDPCGGDTPVCDEDNDTCVECLADGDCGGDTPVCDTAQNICVECLADDDCGGDTPVCDTTQNICVECLADGDCGGDTPFCDTAQNLCVECLADGDCSDGLFCNGAETCTDGVCGEGTDPCEGATPVCDEAQDICTPPECAVDGDCADALFCNGAETCADGSCVDGSDPCGGDTPICDETDDICVTGCINNDDCDDAYTCQENVCVPKCRLLIKHKKLSSAKLTKDKKITFKITTSTFGPVDMGPDIWILEVKPNTKKGTLKVKAIVPAGLTPQIIPVWVADCFGQVEILE